MIGSIAFISSPNSISLITGSVGSNPGANKNADGQKTQNEKVQIHSMAAPGFDPTEPVISEIELGLDIKAIDPIIQEVAANLPDHDRTKRYAQENDRRDIHRRKQP